MTFDDVINKIMPEVKNGADNDVKQPTTAVNSNKRIVEGYAEMFYVELAGTSVFLGENPAADYPYLVCNIKTNNPLGMEERHDGIVSDDYLEIIREFVKRIDGLTASLETERRESGIPYNTLTATEYCLPNSQHACFKDQLLIIKPEILAPEYRSAEHQLAICTGGFGADENARGRAVYVTELYSGNNLRYNRNNIAGIANPQKLPSWAVNKLAEYRDNSTSDMDKNIPKPTLKAKLDNAKKSMADMGTERTENKPKTRKNGEIE
jgi:hypothetical protein